MRHLLVGATLVVLAPAATFGVAAVLESRAAAPLPAPVAGDPAKPGKLSPAEGRSSGFHRASF